MKKKNNSKKETQELKVKDIKTMTEMSIISVNDILAKVFGPKKANNITKSVIALVLAFILVCTLVQLGVKTLTTISDYEEKQLKQQAAIELTEREFSVIEREKAVTLREVDIANREKAVAKREATVNKKENEQKTKDK
jgi:hypothetical protein